MTIRNAAVTGAVIAAIMLGVHAVNAEDLAVAGRLIASKHENAIIKIQMVTQMKMSMEGRETSKRESKSENTATIIDPSGLAVVSLSAINPSEMLTSMGYGDGDGMSLKSQVTDVKYRMNDGTEIPAKVVLRDRDLDLAFIRPLHKQAEPFPYIDMSQSMKPERLDQVVMLSRLGKVANRALSVCVDRIQAVVDKPRTFYVPGVGSMMGEMGSPVFCCDGKVVGLLLLRMLPKGGSEDGSGMGSNVLPMILPASDIFKVAAQASDKDVTIEPSTPAPSAAKTAPTKAPVKAPAKGKTPK